MKLFIREAGQGTAAVVLIHGLGASHRAFDELISLGEETHRFFAIDLPETGHSERWAPTRSPRDMAFALADHFEARGLTRFRLFGHSFGGLVALSLAAHRPEWVERLVIANTPGLGLPSDAKAHLDHPTVSHLTEWLSRRSLPAPKWVVKQYLKWLWGTARVVTDAAVMVSVENAKHPQFLKAMFDSLNEITRYELPLAALKRAPFGKEVIWGERDRLVSVIDGERLALALGATFTVLPDTGHCTPEEQPSAVLEAIDGE